ncbi:hypothetical protein BRD08_04200 [Halobacteriales archaeon SW_10_66_29]|jgi:hypothetical protein|nr:MAG: hypothetical protein BRC66_08080 [Halobacteriales archaeon QH_2_66_30]PSP46201.1 MAG: hypothetical protein BRC69_04150 [Halobacteriales archaeon QH_6_66_25]PSQ36759.1 MAG: hypothetical protein BRD08_04200 [Halobacteriales archaeon SW_10_66_29]
MYGNTTFGEESTSPELTPDQRKVLRRELSSVAARTRELLPGEFVVGSEITHGVDGPRATVAVQPPVGAVVSADYAVDGEVDIDETEREDLAVGLAASAALQVKEAMHDDRSPTAR